MTVTSALSHCHDKYGSMALAGEPSTTEYRIQEEPVLMITMTMMMPIIIIIIK